MADNSMSLQTAQTTDTVINIPVGVESLLVNQWLEETAGKSEKTKAAYSMVMRHFREQLEARGIDVFADPREVTEVARRYVRTSYDRRGRVRDGSLSEGTINQRLAILSSFYTFCHGEEPRITNPIDRCKREKNNVHDAAAHLDAEDVMAVLKNMRRDTLQDKRDYALLLLAFTTGRRAAELVALIWGDLHPKGKGIEVTWQHCKGNKTMKDVLGENTREALFTYIEALYGSLSDIASDVPIFVSLSRNNYGKAMTTQAAADISKKFLGTSKMHTTRHSFAVNSERAGLTLSEIGERLGHASLKTTSDYMKRLHSSENKRIKQLESLYGL